VKGLSSLLIDGHQSCGGERGIKVGTDQLLQLEIEVWYSYLKCRWGKRELL